MSEPLPKRAKAMLRRPTDEAVAGDEDTTEIVHEEDELQLTPEELAAQADAAERDAFSQRVLLRDKEATKKVGAAGVEHLAKSLEAEDTRRQQALQGAKDRATALEVLREMSRQEYLTKRELQKVLLLEQELQDEERLFASAVLTDRELADLALKRELLQIVKSKQQLEQLEKMPQYSMPENYLDEKDRLARQKKERELFERYRVPDEQEEATFVQEDAWEKVQLANARKLLHIGVSDLAIDGKEALGDEYGFLLDEEQIEFVLAAKMEGEMPPLMDPREALKLAQRKKRESLEETRRSLPVYSYRDDLIAAVLAFPVLVIVGETGSGKTTQIPQYLYDAGYTKDAADGTMRMIGCTQPRRVAAMSVAARVAQEMDIVLGHQVGYSIRFEDCSTPKTRLKYMTDGMLIREFLNDPALSNYSVIMIDEAHERTIATDVLLGLLKDLLRVRTDLKLLISSATLDATKFSAFFDDAPIFNIPGRRFPVDIYYTKAPEADYLNAILLTVLQIHLSQPLPGDILVFLTGQEDIEAVGESLAHVTKALGSRIPELIIAPIYANLPSDMQAKIFAPTPPKARKVVLATNIAETSITIDGILYVIDPGLVKQKSYAPKTGLESLVVVPCSQASANQRAGRAGRVAPGKCFRLYTRWSFDNELDPSPIPEIQRSDLSALVLLLKSLGIHDLLHFDFLDAPPPDTLIHSLELLYALGALNRSGDLTKLGRRMAELPLEPMLAKTLLASETYMCSQEILTIAAMLSLQNSLFYRPPVQEQRLLADNQHKAFLLGSLPGGDPLLLLHIYNTWIESNYSAQWCYENFLQFKALNRARAIREQLASLLVRVEVPTMSVLELEAGSNVDPSVAIRKALTAGYFFNVSRLTASGDGYKNVKSNQPMSIHPSSCLFKPVNSGELPPKWILYYELVFTTKEYMRQNCEIAPEWLTEVALHYYTQKDLVQKPRSGYGPHRD